MGKVSEAVFQFHPRTQGLIYYWQRATALARIKLS